MFYIHYYTRYIIAYAFHLLNCLCGQVRNEKARRYLSSMRKKKPIPFSQKFPNANPLALRLLERMLAFEPKDRPTAEEVIVFAFLSIFLLCISFFLHRYSVSWYQALADPYFKGLAKVEREPSAQPVTKMEFEFERRRITKEDVRELIYREILEYHPKMLKEHLEGSEPTGFMYPRYCLRFYGGYGNICCCMKCLFLLISLPR